MNFGNGALLDPALGRNDLASVGEMGRACFLTRRIRISQLGRIRPELDPVRIAGSATGLMAVCNREGNVSLALFEILRQPIDGHRMAKNRKDKRRLLMRK
jgi:hypothetical protein